MTKKSKWRTCTIGDLCDDGIAELQTGPFGTQLHAYDYLEEGIPVVPTEAIRNRRIDATVLPRVSPAKANELSRHRLQQGDILFARRGAQATGHIGYVRDAEQGYLCGTGAIRLRCNQENASVSHDFLSHVLANPVSVDWFKSHAIGATMPNLNEGIIRSFPISLPPLEEQVTIAAILGALDDKIELNRRTNETLEAMARALFESWFVDFDPVRAKAAGKTPVGPPFAASVDSKSTAKDAGAAGQPPPMDPATAALFPDSFEDSPLGAIPKGWKVGNIGDATTVVGGSTPSTSNPEFWDNGAFNWTTPKDLSSLPGPALLESERKITEAGLAEIGSGLLPVGTVLLSSRAPIGYLAVAEVPTAVNQGFIAMVCGKNLPTQYVRQWTRANMEGIKSRANGTTFLEVSKVNFRPIEMVLPRAELVQAFSGLSEPLYRRVVANLRESKTLAAIRDALLPKLLSGEVDV